ncbi:MAG: response regulator transcription factor [Deltaproteobacteria bacterium]|nr:response regulator transcription factor [Deltaproteobacteria bacterium]
MHKIKVLIVDDHVLIREGLKQLLSLEDDIEIVAEAGSGLECLELLKEHYADIIFMDIKMPGINGIETTRLVCQKYPQVKVIMLTIYEDDEYVTNAIQAGAKGFVLKKVSRNELIKVMHNIMKDQAFLDASVTAAIFKKIQQKEKGFKSEAKAELSLRELEVLNHLVEGFTDRKISEALCISEHTVRSHLKSIYRQLRVSSRSQAVAKGIQDRIINRDNAE